MGCNCKKDTTTLTLRKRLRQEMKKKIADMKQLWQESKGDGTITSNKDQLGFKPKE